MAKQVKEPKPEKVIDEQIADDPFRKKHFQEWRVEIHTEQKDGKTVKRSEKLKLMRPVVKITEDHAEVLNRGVIDGPGNKYALMYFLPETNQDA